MKLLIVFMIVAAQLVLAADPEEKVPFDFSTIIQKYQAQDDFQGNIWVRKGDQVILEHSSGIANEAFQVPHDLTTRFMIASITKSFTAVAILKLQEMGLLQLSDSIAQYIEIDEDSVTDSARWKSVTIHQLLTHTAGLIRDVKSTRVSGPQIYEPSPGMRVDMMLQEENVFLYSPEKAPQYSNFGYLTLAALIEATTFTSYEEFLKTHILNPLKMNSTGSFHRMKVIPKMAEGYYWTDGIEIKLKRCCVDATSFIGSHNLYSDLDDLVSWIEFLFSDGASVLKTSSLEAMKTPYFQFDDWPNDDQEPYYGYGLMIDQVQGHRRYWHDGMEWGYLSLISHIPSLDLSIVILSNHHTSAVSFEAPYVQAMADEITKQVMKPQTEKVPHSVNE